MDIQTIHDEHAKLSAKIANIGKMYFQENQIFLDDWSYADGEITASFTELSWGDKCYRSFTFPAYFLELSPERLDFEIGVLRAQKEAEEKARIAQEAQKRLAEIEKLERAKLAELQRKYGNA